MLNRNSMDTFEKAHRICSMCSEFYLKTTLYSAAIETEAQTS